MKKLSVLVLTVVLISCNTTAQDKNKKNVYPVSKTDAEWKADLDELEYYVLRKAGTERAFSSELNKNYEKGVYACAACGTPLFKSDHKYDSGSGWPSFDRVINGNVAFSTERDLGYTSTEEHCANCGGHLGHVFDDGPKSTGKRHCVNGAALDFIPIEIKNE
jgi:peptide-methionine (R)-S-oxide reductase